MRPCTPYSSAPAGWDLKQDEDDTRRRKTSRKEHHNERSCFAKQI